jgi:hypothetical protein
MLPRDDVIAALSYARMTWERLNGFSWHLKLMQCHWKHCKLILYNFIRSVTPTWGMLKTVSWNDDSLWLSHYSPCCHLSVAVWTNHAAIYQWCNESCVLPSIGEIRALWYHASPKRRKADLWIFVLFSGYTLLILYVPHTVWQCELVKGSSLTSVCLTLRVLRIEKSWMNFNGVWYELCAVGGHQKTMFFRLLQSVLTAWGTH